MAESAIAKVELRAMRELAQIVAAPGDLRERLQGVAEAIAAGREDRDVYVYVYDSGTNELLLSGATESPAARYVGVLRVAYGDGVTGWVAASRQSYLVPDEPTNDPHFLAYPDIGEERYGAIFSVPIVSRLGDLLGCITVWALSGQHFDAVEVPFVERAAALVAGTFHTERLSESDRVHAQIAAGVEELTSMVASGTATPSTIEFATELALTAARADIAVAFVIDPSGADRMYIKSAGAPDWNPALRPVQRGRSELLMVEQEIRRGRITWRTAIDMVAVAFDGIVGAITTAPVRFGAEELGIMACYRIEATRFTVRETSAVASIANQTATALKLSMLSESTSDRHGLNWFLRELSSGHIAGDALRKRARSVGLDSASSYVFIVGSTASQPLPGVPMGAAMPALAELLERLPELPRETRYAVTPHQTVAIVPWARKEESISTLRMPLLGVCTRVRASAGTPLTFGVSGPVAAVGEYGGALAEAREAMTIGSTLENPNGVFTLDDVGHHLLLSRVSSVGSVRDRYATAVARIAEYDRVKGTELLETLAVFLHYRSQSTASRELFVHRNTLNQRLSRVSRLSGFDVFSSSEWFPLQLALKVHQARSGGSPVREDQSPQYEVPGR